MSKDKAEENAREYAGITPDVNNVDQLPNQFVFVKEKYFNFIAGYTQAVTDLSTDLSTENAQLREALREIVKHTDDMMNARTDLEYNLSSVNRTNAIEQAKQLLTDNTKENEKDNI